MSDLWSIIRVVYYLLFVLVLFLYARYRYKRSRASNGKISKFGLVALVIFTVVFGIYGVICGPPGESVGDRYNYAVRFENSRFEESVKENSLGLYVVESGIHLFSNNSSVLFFVVSALFFCINIYCYRKIDETIPVYLLLLFLSTFGLFGFYALKQALSLAFANLAFTEYWCGKKRIWSVMFLVVAILCHEAAWILLPCFLLARYCGGSSVKRAFLYVGVVVVAIFFPQISKYFVSLFSDIPGMESQINSYANEAGAISVDMNYFTIFKSLPYYIMTLVAIICRKRYKDRIKNYDFLLVFSILCSVFSLLSMYMYWMFRFALYCYVPCFLFAAQISRKMEERNGRTFKAVIVCVLLFLMIKLLLQYYFIYGGIV